MAFKKYYFFSDTHLADGTELDDFSQKFEDDMKFRRKICLIARRVDVIVGVGDIFELWQTSHNAIRSAHFIIWKWIQDHVKLLKGNHDFSTFANQTMKFKTKSGKRVLVSHGFQNNKQMSKWYTKAFIYLVGKLEKFFPWLDNKDKHPKLYKLLPAEHRKVFQKKFHKVKGIEKDVEEYCRSFIGKFDIIIVGHSHKQVERRLNRASYGVDVIGGSILMLNCGHNTGGQFQGLLFDANTDKYEFV